MKDNSGKLGKTVDYSFSRKIESKGLMDKKAQSGNGLVDWMLRIILAGIFIYAGGIKLLDPTLFAIKVRNYDLLSDPWVAVVALFLPCLEVICGLAIVSRRLERGALAGVVLMLLMFLYALLSAWARGLNIDCGCFGEALDRGSFAMAVATDVVLLLIAMRLLAVTRKKKAISDKP